MTIGFAGTRPATPSKGVARSCENVGIMTRLLIAGTAALAIVTPATVLGAPSPRTAAPSAYRATASRSASARAGEFSVGGDNFRVPLELDMRPRPLPGTVQHPSGVWYQPAWYAPTCLNGLGTPSAASMLPGASSSPADFTIGSLADERSKNLFSSTPSAGGVSGLGVTGGAASTSSPLTVQYSAASNACGPGGFGGF